MVTSRVTTNWHTLPKRSRTRDSNLWPFGSHRRWTHLATTGCIRICKERKKNPKAKDAIRCALLFFNSREVKHTEWIVFEWKKQVKTQSLDAWCHSPISASLHPQTCRLRLGCFGLRDHCCMVDNSASSSHLRLNIKRTPFQDPKCRHTLREKNLVTAKQ